MKWRMISAFICLLLVSSAVADSSQSPEISPDDVDIQTAINSVYESFVFSHPNHPGVQINGRIKILYLSNATGTLFSPQCEGGRHPVVVFLSGAQVESNRYQWLGEKLVSEQGVVWVTVDMLVPVSNFGFLIPMPGGIYDTELPNPGLVALFQKLREMNNGSSPMEGCLDVDRVILGGHSWGGRVTLVDGANKGFFPNVVAAFVYAAHVESVPGPGYEPRTMLPLEGDVPLLLMAGLKDKILGTGRMSPFATGLDGIRYMVQNAIGPGRRLYYIELEDFYHMTIIDPEDKTHPGAKIEQLGGNKTEKLEVFGRIVALFVQKYAFDESEVENDLGVVLFDEENPYIGNVTVKG